MKFHPILGNGPRRYCRTSITKYILSLTLGQTSARNQKKMKDWQERDLEVILREVQKIYVRQDEEKMKTKAKIMVAISRENTGSQDHRRDPRRKGEHGYAERPRQENQKGPTCYYCGKEGHFKRNCRQLLKDQKIHQATQMEDHEG